MEPTGFDVDELIEFWTLLDEDRSLLSGRRGATALGFAVLLKHYSRYGRFPRGRSEVPDEVIAFVARQLEVAAGDLGFYEWAGSTIEYHRAQIRDHLGYRVATLADQETLTGWLSEAVAHAERQPDRVREELLAEFRRLRIEPPTAGRILRMVRSALRAAEQNWARRRSAVVRRPLGPVRCKLSGFHSFGPCGIQWVIGTLRRSLAVVEIHSCADVAIIGRPRFQPCPLLGREQ